MSSDVNQFPLLERSFPKNFTALMQRVDKLPHHTLAKLVVEHVGNMPELTSKVSAMGVSIESFIIWMSSEAGKSAIKEIRDGFNEVLDSMLTVLLHRLYNEVVDRVQKGDIKIDQITGEQFRIPLRAITLSNVFDRVFEKREKLRDRRYGSAVKLTTISEEGVPISRYDDSESLARTMRVLASKGSGLVVRKKSEEVELSLQVDVEK